MLTAAKQRVSELKIKMRPIAVASILELLWTVVDFKTDEEFSRFSSYATQIGVYGKAVQSATGQPASVVLMKI